jgi:TolA-binding protein
VDKLVKQIVIIIFLCNPTILLAQNLDNAKLANEYYQQGEFNKATAIYEELEKDKSSIASIHANYQELLWQINPDHLEKYLDKVLKYFPGNLQYEIDQISYYIRIGDESKEKKLIQEIRKTYSANQYQLSNVAKLFSSKKLWPQALQFYDLAREVSKNPYDYSLEVAAIYRTQNDKDAMIAEYIKYAESNPANINYVKNLFQNILIEEEDQQLLESSLISRIQSNPSQPIYPELLIWLQLQRKEFYAAFVQARALDKRNNLPGDESMKIANIAMQNGYWQDASEIFIYIIKNYLTSRNYPSARSNLIASKEQMVKNQFPVDTVAIRSLIADYQKLLDELGTNPTTLATVRSQALLHAFYLNEEIIAVQLLESIISNRAAPSQLVASSKLDLGDIYLLLDEPWESTLLYSQVEKSNKETPTGYEAKLRNAKLNYYTGNFALAKSHLDILKLATTRTTANDALALGQLITDNTILDTSDFVMQQFAAIDLLLFTNQKAKAKEQIDIALEKFKAHSIYDELQMRAANLELENGNYLAAINHLDVVIEKFPTEVNGDDALYLKGVILQEYLLKIEDAQETYLKFLKTYPGSRHSAEVRKLIRNNRSIEQTP